MIPFPYQAGEAGRIAQPAAGGGGGGVTWNPADKASDITLSAGDLTVGTSATSVHRAVRATASKSSGKWYFEAATRPTGAGDRIIGVANSSLVLTNYPGSSAGSWGYLQVNGQKANNGSLTAFGNSFATPIVIGVAVDLTAGKIWFARANVWQASGNPAAGTNEAFSGLTGSLFPCVSVYRTAEIWDGAFTAGAFTYSPPSGFTGWGD